MKTANFPRIAISSGLRELGPSKDCWLISIADPGTEHASCPLGIFERVLALKFADVTATDGYSNCISHAQAEDIADLIKDAMSLRKSVYVNCVAGVSRSGGVVQVLLDLGWEFDETGLSPARIPNTLVYGRIAEHFDELQQSWSEQFLGRKK